jgi:hypothetical protein
MQEKLRARVRRMDRPCRIRSALGFMLIAKRKTRWVVDGDSATIATKKDATKLIGTTRATCSLVPITNRELYSNA